MAAPAPARPAFREQLATLEQRTLEGLDLVITQLDRTVEAIAGWDIELAGWVIADDDRVDGRYLELHQSILSLLALQAPVASELRVTAALLHTIGHIERIGDQCVNIAKLLPISGNDPPANSAIIERLLAMGRAARDELVQAGEALRTRSLDLARDLARKDRELNRLNREIFRIAIEAGEDPDAREWALTATLMARAFERIGDNAVDIGEQTAFIVSGLFVEFSDASHPQPPA